MRLFMIGQSYSTKNSWEQADTIYKTFAIAGIKYKIERPFTYIKWKKAFYCYL